METIDPSSKMLFCRDTSAVISVSPQRIRY